MAEDGKRTYSAKQVATRIGTDAKQLRKFLRDPNSGYKAVGQGGRYDFPEDDLPKIQVAFTTWNSTKTRRNRPASADRTPTSAAGLIPGQRRDSPTPRPRVSKDNKEGLHHNGLDEDTLQDRFAGIAARVQRHGLVAKGGRLVPRPQTQEAHIHNPYPPKETIPGLMKPPTTESQLLDFSEVEDAVQDLLDYPGTDDLDELGLADEGGGDDSTEEDHLSDWELGLDEVDLSELSED